MHHHLLFPTTTTTTTATTTMRSPSSVHHPKLKSHCNNANAAAACKHSPSATLDVLIMLVVLFSGAFLLSSYFSYIFNSLSLLLLRHHHFSFPYLLAFFLFLAAAAAAALDFCAVSRRRCRRSGCRGLKNAMEFDLKIQTEDAVRGAGAGDGGEIERVLWKGGSEGNPDYECLRAELRKMAPPNGRAVLLFRAPCGCVVAKLEGWGPKKGKRHKR